MTCSKLFSVFFSFLYFFFLSALVAFCVDFVINYSSLSLLFRVIFTTVSA